MDNPQKDRDPHKKSDRQPQSGTHRGNSPAKQGQERDDQGRFTSEGDPGKSGSGRDGSPANPSPSSQDRDRNPQGHTTNSGDSAPSGASRQKNDSKRKAGRSGESGRGN